MTEERDNLLSDELESQVKAVLADLAASTPTPTVESAEPQPPLPPQRTPRLICTPRPSERTFHDWDEDDADYASLKLVMADRDTHHKSRGDEINDLSLDECPPAPREQHSPARVLLGLFSGNRFRRGDGTAACVRKGGFWLSLTALLLSLLYVLYALWLLPMLNVSRYDEVAALYHGEQTGAVSTGTYPKGMLPPFRPLYDLNADVRGYVEFTATSNEDFLGISYPVVQGNVYATRDFFGHSSEYGTPFFDERNSIDGEDRVLYVYGQNGMGGQMFAGLNELVGSVYRARAAATLRVDTLYEQGTYQVFAVILTDEDETGEAYMDTRRTAFADDADFLSYVAAIRERSLFDYPVEVTAEDRLVVLSTVASPSVSKLDNGRVMVFARRVTQEDYVNTARIVKNEDVVMPLAWYINQDLSVHAYYENEGATTSATPTSESTTAATTTATTTTSAEETTTTTTATTTRRPTTTTIATTTTAATTAEPTTTTEETTTTTTTVETTTTTTTEAEE